MKERSKVVKFQAVIVYCEVNINILIYHLANFLHNLRMYRLPIIITFDLIWQSIRQKFSTIFHHKQVRIDSIFRDFYRSAYFLSQTWLVEESQRPKSI